MNYLSLFSGIEAASLAWQPLGWHAVAFAEIEPFPCAVLAHHHPNIPNLGDVTHITHAQIAALGQIDVVVGGSPCQGLSLAGARKGLADERSGLFHEQVRIFHAAHTLCGARYLVWENVPGALSSQGGRDFAVVAGTLAGCDLTVPGDGWRTEGVALGRNGLLEWAVLDAQWFGLAQRRKRLFAVLDTGNWANRAPILLERESVRGDTAPRRKSQQSHSRAGLAGVDGYGLHVPDVAMCLNAGAMGRQDFESETFVIHGSQDPIVNADVANAFGANCGQENVVYTLAERGRDDGRSLEWRSDGTANALLTPNGSRAGIGVGAIASGATVRRLTSCECERLQGFPDEYTRIAWRGKPADQCPDGPRYKALGNSMAVPVMRWIGEQMKAATRANTDHAFGMEKAA